jgi:hypothetical protein
LNSINNYVGTYFSREYVYDKILHMTDEEVEDMKADIANDTDLQQQMAAQQAGPGAEQAAAMSREVSTQQPAPYNPENPVVEMVPAAINNIMELRKVKL